MRVAELYARLSAEIPDHLSCDWDNDGLMCCPDYGAEVKRVLLTLDVTDDAVDYAVAGGYDTIVSHHPMIFRKLKGITEPKHIKLILNGIAVMSFHTRLDLVEGGVNDVLAARFALRETARFTAEGIGVIGTLPGPLAPSVFAEQIKKTLGVPMMETIMTDTPCHRVAVVGGDGKDFVPEVLASGADTYLVGALNYNTLSDLLGRGVNVFVAGHYYTEQPVLAALADRVCRLDSTIVCTVFECNRIRIL